MKRILSYVLCGIAFGLIPAKAIEQGTSGFNTTAPTSSNIPNWNVGWGSGGVTGWNYVGVVNGASSVYLGNGWVLTAAHVGAGNLNLNGTTYTLVSGSAHSITSGSNTADLTVFQVSPAPSLPPLIIMSSAPTIATTSNPGSAVAMLGFGGGSKTWGLNWVTTVNIPNYPVYSYLSTDFETAYGTTAYGSVNNARVISGDSGGGDFIYNSSTGYWELAGVNEDFDSSMDSYMVQLSPYASQINTIAGLSGTPPPTSLGTYVNDTDPGITYQANQFGYSSGRGYGDYDDDVHYAGGNGAYATYTFTGTGIAYLTETNSDEGNVSVSIDGGAATTVYCYTATRSAQQIMYSIQSLAYGTHTIKVTKVDGSVMLVDGFVVYNISDMVNDNYSGITYQANQWGYSSGRGYGDFDNDVHYAGGNGAYLSYTFTGTGVAVLGEAAADEGNVSIAIDGGTPTTVNTYSATRVGQKVIYGVGGLAYGSHTVVVTKVSGSVMTFDGFGIIRPPTYVNDTDPGITYTGSWAYSSGRGYGDFDDDVHYCGNNGNTMSYTFTGVGVSFLTETYSDEGTVNVSIDGGTATPVSCVSSTRAAQQAVFTQTGLAYGSHTIVVTKVSGTFMLVDALVVY